MAKKKSLKAKLAKKAKAAAESPSRNTNSPAEPAPSTSKGNAEPAPKVRLNLFMHLSMFFPIVGWVVAVIPWGIRPTKNLFPWEFDKKL